MDADTANMSDHDLLIRIDERVRKIDGCLRGHLKRHLMITLVAIGAAFTALFSCIGTVLLWNLRTP